MLTGEWSAMKRCTLLAVALLLSGVAAVRADIARPPFPKQPVPRQPIPGQPLPLPGLPQQPVVPVQPIPLQPVPTQPVVPDQTPHLNATLGPRNAELAVEIDPHGKVARLQVPINLLGGNVKRRADAGQLPTLIAGVALTCAFVSGGFWLVRRGRARTLAAVLLTLSLLAAVGSVAADFGPRPKKELPPAHTPVELPAGILLTKKLVIEVVPAGTKVKLIVPKDMVLDTDKTEP